MGWLVSKYQTHHDGKVVKVCGKKDGEEKTYQNQCMADCDGAEPANGGNWEQGVPCTEDIELSDAKCGLLDNKRVVRV